MITRQFLKGDAESVAVYSPCEAYRYTLTREWCLGGRKALFVSEHFTTRIIGLPPARSEALLAELFAHSTQPQFVYRHHWQPHDLVFWDNRAVLHLATGVPAGQRRKLYRTTIEGDVPV